jgi:hypothetical protein
MPGKRKLGKGALPSTRAVSPELFAQVYDSPHSLPGKEAWVTRDKDVRVIERLLGMEPNTIGAPLWVSGDQRHCPECGRETNWLDIVSSALAQVHQKELLVKVILGEKKYVNTETPRAIANLFCYQCKAPIRNIRSFKCHNWAYAKPALLKVLERVNAAGK